MPLFTPPTRTQIAYIEGSLSFGYDVPSTVWKDANGVWHAQEVPYVGDLATAQRVLTSTGPVTVDTATANELIAAGIGTIT